MNDQKIWTGGLSAYVRVHDTRGAETTLRVLPWANAREVAYMAANAGLAIDGDVVPSDTEVSQIDLAVSYELVMAGGIV